jgi:UDP-glucose 4-epimerase
MVSIYLSQAIRSGKIIVKGAPDRYRDFVYIDDAVEAFLKADNFDGSGFFEFNISTGIETTVSDLCKALQNNLGEIDILYKGSTPGDIHGYTGEHTKALKLLGWKPKINLNKGLNTMVEWAKDGKFK